MNKIILLILGLVMVASVVAVAWGEHEEKAKGGTFVDPDTNVSFFLSDAKWEAVGYRDDEGNPRWEDIAYIQKTPYSGGHWHVAYPSRWRKVSNTQIEYDVLNGYKGIATRQTDQPAAAPAFPVPSREWGLIQQRGGAAFSNKNAALYWICEGQDNNPPAEQYLYLNGKPSPLPDDSAARRKVFEAYGLLDNAPKKLLVCSNHDRNN